MATTSGKAAGLNIHSCSRCRLSMLDSMDDLIAHDIHDMGAPDE